MSFWSGKSVLVTGGAGFIGSHLVERLLGDGARVRVVGRNPERLRAAIGENISQVEFLAGDLLAPSFAEGACDGMEAVFHLAAQVAGIGYNSRHQGTIYTKNLLSGLNVIDAAARGGVERLLLVSSACVYPRDCSIPTPESEGFRDDPEPTNLGYGWAKRALEVQARCYAQEFPMKIAIARPYNAYGPRDDFAWETSHVIPALIRKAVEHHDPIIVWGDGTQTRSFLYVDDFVAGLLLALERYAVCDPVNIGTEEETTVGELVRMIIELSGSNSQTVLDTEQPHGQLRRVGDFSKTREKLRFVPTVSLREGLARTIQWYKENEGINETHAGVAYAK
jgi:GDP-L-fucose synthase